MYKRRSTSEEMKMLFHPIPPLYDEHSKILILGSFPRSEEHTSELQSQR